MTVRLPISGTPVSVDFDADHARQRFAEEREKRLRPETLGQFSGLSDVLEFADSDRYADPIVRDAVVEEVEVAILGGGFGGLCAGAHLAQQGVTDIRIIEQGGDFGGTWYWNRYPGVQCDVESHLYMPLLDETGYVPSKRYADGDEIFEHARRIGRHFDLYRAALFQTTVTAAQWRAEEGRWEVRTDRGDVIRARFVLRSNGVINKPQIPKVSGINDFAGKIFHTSRWDYAYTGGDQHGNLEKLRDKRVAIVGTGASGIQAIPYLAEYAQELFVIQRTPSTVGIRDNRPTDPEWAAGLKPGWQAARNHNFNSVTNGHNPEENLVDDFWTKAFPPDGRTLIEVPPASLPVMDQMTLAQLADVNATLQIHRRIEEIVKDPDTAEALKPWYGFFCKRPGFNDEYYPAFNRPSVTLVPAPGGVEGITETGLVVDGKQYDVDLIIFATGFETGSSTMSRYGYDILGRDGLPLSEYFADGTKTLHGLLTHGFPNFFELGLSQNAYTINFAYMLDRKAHQAARIIGHAIERGVATIEPDLGAQSKWVQTVREAGKIQNLYLSTCTPGYYNGQGDVSHAFFTDVYKISEVDYWDMIDRWWDAGTLEGLALDAPVSGPPMAETPLPTNHTSTPLDPDAQAVADMMGAVLPGGLSSLGVQGVRAFSEQSNAQTPPPVQVHQVSEHQAPGPHGDVRVRLYRPESDVPVPVLLYIHGGGWTMGSIDGGVDYLVRDIVQGLGIAVAAVDYRLAPEHKFPIPVEDCQAALAWLRDTAADLGVDPSQIAIGGDSAGANISAAITHLDRGSSSPLAAQVLMFPATEYAGDRPSWIENANAPLLTAVDTLWFWEQYLRTEADRTDPRATPANAESFADLPPALVVVAGHDPLRDDGLHYAELLASAGTPVEIARFDGSFHDFILMPTLAAYPQGLSTITGFLSTALASRDDLVSTQTTS